MAESLAIGIFGIMFAIVPFTKSTGTVARLLQGFGQGNFGSPHGFLALTYPEVPVRMW